MASPDAIANWRKAFSSGRTALKDTRKLLAQETNQSLVAQILTESKGLDIAGKAWNKRESPTAWHSPFARLHPSARSTTQHASKMLRAVDQLYTSLLYV